MKPRFPGRVLLSLALAAGVMFVAASVFGFGRLGVTAAWTYCASAGAALERQLQDGVVAQIPRDPEGFIILGGGLHAFQNGDGGSGARISAALALAKTFPQATFIYTGAGEAAEVGRIFAENGVRAPLLEDQATTTFENARNVGGLIGARRGRPWVLITSAWHMKRALAIFRAQGFDAHAYPVDFLQPGRNGRCGAATREVVSVLYYRLRGRI